MIKAPISGYWAVTANERVGINDPPYFAWLVAKDAARGISALFLMGLFLKVDARTLPQKNREVRINHFLVPAVMLAVLGAFLECLIDQYVGPLDSRLRFVSRCNNTVNNTLCFFVPVCFNFCLLSSVCRLFLSFVLFLEGNIGWSYTSIHSSFSVIACEQAMKNDYECDSHSFLENSVNMACNVSIYSSCTCY